MHENKLSVDCIPIEGASKVFLTARVKRSQATSQEPNLLTVWVGSNN